MKILESAKLTEREKDIVLLILEGKTKREIAESLCVSVSTVKTNVEKIYQKFGLHNKAELIIYIIKNKMVDFN